MDIDRQPGRQINTARYKATSRGRRSTTALTQTVFSVDVLRANGLRLDTSTHIATAGHQHPRQSSAPRPLPARSSPPAPLPRAPPPFTFCPCGDNWPNCPPPAAPTVPTAAPADGLVLAPLGPPPRASPSAPPRLPGNWMPALSVTICSKSVAYSAMSVTCGDVGLVQGGESGVWRCPSAAAMWHRDTCVAALCSEACSTMYMCMCICVYMCACVCLSVYILRERERDR